MSFKICFEYFDTVAPPGGIFQFHKNDLPQNSDFVSIDSHKTNSFKDSPPYQVEI